MKKIFSLIVLSAFVLSGLVYAEQQYQNNGTNIGIANKTNLVGCTITRSGEIATINCQSETGPITITGNLSVTGTTAHAGVATFAGGISGVNWQAVPQSNTTGINWSGADILVGSNGGVNWSSLRTSFGNTSTSVNWQAFGV